jgi:hypothetical protein
VTTRGDEFGRLVESFEALGLSPTAARAAAAGRGGGMPPEDGFDAMVSLFETLGLSASEAKFAAAGRGGSELDARRQAREAANSITSGRSNSRAELDRLGEQLRQLREAIDRTQDPGRQVVVAERSVPPGAGLTQIQEAGRLGGAAGGTRWRARLIQGDIWGTSGFYPRQVLERATSTTRPRPR